MKSREGEKGSDWSQEHQMTNSMKEFASSLCFSPLNLSPFPGSCYICTIHSSVRVLSNQSELSFYLSLFEEPDGKAQALEYSLVFPTFNFSTYALQKHTSFFVFREEKKTTTNYKNFSSCHVHHKLEWSRRTETKQEENKEKRTLLKFDRSLSLISPYHTKLIFQGK